MILFYLLAGRIVSQRLSPAMFRSVLVAAVAGTAAAFAPSAPLAGRTTTRAVGMCARNSQLARLHTVV